MESDQLFDCTVKRRQLMGQTVYISLMLDRSILLYLFQLNYNYKSAFVQNVPENISTSRRCKYCHSEWNSSSSSPPASSYTSSSFPTCSSPSSTLHHRSRNKDNLGENLLPEEPLLCRTSLLQGWQATDGW